MRSLDTQDAVLAFIFAAAVAWMLVPAAEAIARKIGAIDARNTDSCLTLQSAVRICTGQELLCDQLCQIMSIPPEVELRLPSLSSSPEVPAR